MEATVRSIEPDFITLEITETGQRILWPRRHLATTQSEANLELRRNASLERRPPTKQAGFAEQNTVPNLGDTFTVELKLNPSSSIQKIVATAKQDNNNQNQESVRKMLEELIN